MKPYLLLLLALVTVGVLSYIYISIISKPPIDIEFTRIPSGTLKMGTNDYSLGDSGNGWLVYEIDRPYYVYVANRRKHYSDDEIENIFSSSDLVKEDPGRYTDEQPEHDVFVKEFEISTYEVTRAQYAIFVNAVGYSIPAWHEKLLDRFYKKLGYSEESDAWIFEDEKWKPFPGFENYPVHLVSYDDCKKFAQWLGYRLPTEAEWEWAAAGRNNYNYPWGNTFAYEANIRVDYRSGVFGRAEPVGHRPKDVNEFGVYDLGGNVMEWVEGVYASYPGSDQPFVAGEAYAINRGGSWGFIGDQLAYTRYIFPRTGPSSRWHDIGCRLARDI